MKFENIREWQRATLEKAAAEQNESVENLLINLLLEWADSEYWKFIDEYAGKYNLILEPQEE